MIFDDSCTEEGDGADVLERSRVDACRDESLAGITKHNQRLAAERHRPEESGLRVGHGVELLLLQVVSKDVRRARVIRAAIQVPSLRRKNEPVGNRVAKIEARRRS